MTGPNGKKTALITGASRGLGFALAMALAKDGWELIIDARQPIALFKAQAELSTWTQVTALPGDIGDASHRQALSSAANRAGGLDLLVNNASIVGPSPMPEMLDYPLESLSEVYWVNAIAPLGLVQQLRELLKPGAIIINVTSDAGLEAYPGWGGYGSSKSALEQLSAVLAAENPHWRVYWVDPGDMRTQMHQEAAPGEDLSDLPLPEESAPAFLRLLRSDLPSGRYRAPELSTEAA